VAARWLVWKTRVRRCGIWNVSVVTNPLAVIAGLDPAIYLLRKMMDARVKPAHDGESSRRSRGGNS